jgi:hypothetical protein
MKNNAIILNHSIMDLFLGLHPQQGGAPSLPIPLTRRLLGVEPLSSDEASPGN